MRRLVATGAILASSAGLFGCSSNEVAAKPCEAITQDGKAVHPSAYPLGVVAVKFQESRTAFNEQDEVMGVVRENDGSFILDVKGLPNKLANDYTAFSGTDAVVMIDTPETGSIGLTGGCIERTKDENGTPTSLIELPTA